MSNQATNPTPKALKARPYTNYARTQDDVDDITPTPQPGPVGDPNSTPDTGRADLSPTEKVFEKRYGDLRRLQEKERKEAKQKLDDLQNQILALSNTKKRDLPRTEAEIQVWLQDHPDLASMVVHLADQAAKERTDLVEKKFEQLNEQQHEIARERAYLELKKIHPDVDAIRASEEFHQWAETKPEEIRNWFYENDTDYLLAAEGITLFKAENGYIKKSVEPQRPNTNLDNSRAVTSTPNVAPPAINNDGKKIWKESEIASLKPKQFEAAEEDINLALQEGRIEFDLRDRKSSYSRS